MWSKIAALAKPASAKLKTKSKSGVASASNDHTQTSKSVSEEAVGLRAYLKWEAAGRPDGDGFRFWLEAEREVLRGK